MIGGPSHPAATGDPEAHLVALAPVAPHPAESIFGPHSLSWKVNRESALFLAAGRAALLQLAHPWVAAGIAEHSRTLNDPIGRFHHTFYVMFTIVFAPKNQATAAARRLCQQHQLVRGMLPEEAGRFPQGSRYEANDVSALTWVYATLIDSAVLAYELLLAPLTIAERELYYAESREASVLFGIPSESLPPDWTTFCQYMQEMSQSDCLVVSPTAQRLACQLQTGVGMAIKPPFWYRALTIALLPPRFRGEFQFTYGGREQRAVKRAVAWLRRIYPRLPPTLRFVGPYREVQARLRGQMVPNLSVRLSNRLWIGRTSLIDPTIGESSRE